MAVQAQLYSDHYQNYINMPQDWPFISASSAFHHPQDPRFLHHQKIMNSASDYQNNNNNINNNNLVSSSSSSRRFGMNGFHGLSSELERQRLEMDYYLHFQNEKLKAVLNEETRKREILMMQNYESKMKAILDSKDLVINTAKTRTRELQNYLSMAEQEADKWERKAMETEVMMTDLHTKLKQARATTHEDAESICNNNNGGGNDDEQQKRKMVCKVCHVRSSCILMLPCRHLCCCSGCEGLLMFCPVCESVKNGSLEVYFGLN